MYIIASKWMRAVYGGCVGCYGVSVANVFDGKLTSMLFKCVYEVVQSVARFAFLYNTVYVYA